MLKALLVFAVLMGFILLDFPIFMATILTGVTFVLAGGISMQSCIIKLFGSINSSALLAIPFFVLAGNIMMKSKITDKLVGFANASVGWMKGGLGHVNIVASALFGGIQGSGCADAAGIGGMLIPAMEKQGYDKDFSVAVTAGSAMLSPIIPPSIAMILYSYYTELPVGKLFLGGLVPGILLTIVQMFVNGAMYRKRKYNIPLTKFSFKNFFGTLFHSFGALLMPLIIIVGIVTGIVTATESGVLAVAYGLFYGFFVNKALKLKDLPKILLDTAITTTVVFMTIAAAGIVSNVLVRMHFQNEILNFSVNVLSNKYLASLFMFLIFIILGMFLDPTIIIAMFAASILAIGNSYGFDPIHFGVVMVIMMQLGAITPPVGTFLFIACGIAKLPIEKSVKPMLPYIASVLFVCLLCLFVPFFVTLLPNLM